MSHSTYIQLKKGWIVSTLEIVQPFAHAANLMCGKCEDSSWKVKYAKNDTGPQFKTFKIN